MASSDLDLDALSPWLLANVSGAVEPFMAELIAAGGSNLTYRLVDGAGTTRVLRRPPGASGLPTAHDMDREWRIMSALGEHSDVPVPDCLAQCTDPAVIGAGFYVMEFVDGLIVRDRASAETLTAAEADRATDALIEVQVGFHTLDLESVGLADLGRHDDYVGRQLKRWQGQVLRADVRDLPVLHDLHRRLVAAKPPERVAPALAHGDYRFDNVVLGADHSLAAVLDWELCTTGDPIADFAWSLQYWAEPGDPMTWLADAPTLAPDRFIDRAEVVRRYERASGFDLSDLGFYEAFSWWKQACIVEGVYARRLRGQTGGATQSPIEHTAQRVVDLLEVAQQKAAAAGL